jgi:Cdc6-like AAA superfamily ATPase
VKYIQTYRSFFSTPIHRNLPELINIDNNEIPNNLPVVKRDQMTKCYEHFKREKDNSNGIRPILLIGPPGSGKTTILKYVTEQCEKDGWVVIEMVHGLIHVTTNIISQTAESGPETLPVLWMHH